MKTKIKHIIKVTFSVFLVAAVFLTATHAKDLVAQQPVKQKAARAVETQAARTTDDPVQKSMGDLHNHTDKTMLKSFVKQMGDSPSLAAKRHEKDEHGNEEQSLSMRLFEAFFMMQLAFAYARS